MAGGDVFGGYGAGNLAGWISAAQREGLGYSAALQTFRDVGGHVSNAEWSQVWGQVADIEARYPDAANLLPDQIPGAADYGEWSAGTGGRYATNVWLTYHDNELDVDAYKSFTYITSDPHTPADAIDYALGQFDIGTANGSFDHTVTGAVPGPPMLTVPYGPGT